MRKIYVILKMLSVTNYERICFQLRLVDILEINILIPQTTIVFSNSKLVADVLNQFVSDATSN